MKTLRYLAIAEGISYISFGLTMPIKYVYKIPEPNYAVGMIHGILFIAFCLGALWIQQQKKWPLSTLLVLWVSSLIPFGTFWSERKYLRQ
jgi:integral membrane protein